MERPVNLLLRLHSPGNARGARSASAQKLVLHEYCSAKAGYLRGDTPDKKTQRNQVYQSNIKILLHLEEAFWG